MSCQVQPAGAGGLSVLPAVSSGAPIAGAKFMKPGAVFGCPPPTPQVSATAIAYRCDPKLLTAR